MELDCKSASQHMAFSVFGASLFGDGFLVWPTAREFEEQLIMIAKEACFWETYSVLPLWNKGFQRYKSICARLQGLTKQLIQESKKQHYNVRISCQNLSPENVAARIVAKYEGTSGELVDDLISGILYSSDSSGHFNLAKEIRGNVMGMMFHG